MPNFRDWTASEIVAQMPQARNVLAKHFGRDGITTASGARIRELARWKGVDLNAVMNELDALAKGAPIFG